MLGTSGSLYFKNENALFNGEQEKESIICVRMGLKKPSLAITICHHSASIVMSNSDPRDGFFYPTLTLMIDSYTVVWGENIGNPYLVRENKNCPYYSSQHTYLVLLIHQESSKIV